ncbi:MAG TPA: GH25 family lysozyme [Marmoricola sp.]|nr:GH25 family lysozyme [Marmoricola sp.]
MTPTLEAWIVIKPASRTRRLVRALVGVTTAALMVSTGAAYGYVPGVDTSHYQHSPSLDWQKVAASGVKFAFLKATEGSTYTDPYFKADWAATSKAGIYRGAYHFARPSKGSAKKQADHFASVIGSQKSAGTLPPVLDLEVTGGLSTSALVTWTRTFLKELQARTGRDPIIYVSPYFWIDHLGNNTGFHDYPLWVAHYTSKSQPMVPGKWPTWSFWQTTSSGRISGISGNVDKDVFNGSMSQLQKFALAYKRTPTQLSMDASNSAPTLGEQVTFSGKLTDNGGSALASQTVQVQFMAQGASSWSKVTTVKTGKYGGYRANLAVDQPGSYRAHFTRTTDYRGANSPAVSVTLTPLDSDLTLTTPTTSTNAGSQVSLAGTLTQSGKALAGRHVTVSRRVAGTTTWARVGTVSTDDTGAYTLDFTALQTATYRAKYAGETGYRSATANAGPVTVTRNPATLSLEVKNDAPYLHQKVTMTGRLLTGQKAVANRTVRIQERLPDSSRWRTVASPKTDSAGRYTFSQKAEQAASYRASFAGDQLYVRSTTDPAAVRITPPQRTHTTLTARHTEVRAGRSLLLHGKLIAGGKGIARTVRLWERYPRTSKWHFVYRTATVLPDGTCRISISPRRTTVYRLIFHGGSRYAHSQDGLRITVR